MQIIKSGLVSIVCGLGLAVSSAGCGKEAAEPAQEATTSAAPKATLAKTKPASQARKLFDASVKKKPCTFLNLAQIAQALSIAAGDIKVQDLSQVGSCEWTWDGGGVVVSSIQVRDSAQEAKSSFDMNYASVSAEEAQAAMTLVAQAAQEKEAKQEVEATGKALSDMLAGGLKFADVPDLGDSARLRISGNNVMGKMVFNNEINLLIGNIYFSLTVNKGANETLNRDQIVAVASALVSGLND